MERINIKNLDARKMAGTIIGGIFFLCCILFFTYAFYQWRSKEDIDVSLTINDLGTICNLGPDVNVTNIGPVLDFRDGAKTEFSVTNDSEETVIFDVKLDITSISDNLLADYFDYKIGLDTTGGTNFDYDANIGSFIELAVGINDLFSFSVPAGETYSYQFIVYIDGNIYNDANIQQNSLIANLLVGNCGNVSGTASQKIRSLYNDDSDLLTVNIGGVTTNPTVTLNTNKKIMLDNNGEYRYYGANPNNYVKFNDELWRIISVSNVKSSTTDTAGEMRMKIIRDESIGEYVWDSSEYAVNDGSGVNDWTKADLMTELNTLYYNSQSGTCYVDGENASETCDFTSVGLDATAKSMIDDALWYLGGRKLSEGYQNLYADDYYTFERGTIVYDCTTNDGACPRATIWTGKVGLMYASDYVYATDLSVCKETGHGFSNDTNCKDNDWLFKNLVQSTLSNNIYNSEPGGIGVFYVGASSGSIIASIAALSTADVQPVVYLKSDVIITGGVGTSTNPYTLSIN